MGLEVVVSGIVKLDGEQTNVEVSLNDDDTIIVIDSAREMREFHGRKPKLTYNFKGYEIDSILADQNYLLKMVNCYGYISRDVGNYVDFHVLKIKKAEPLEIGPRLNGLAYDRAAALSHKPEFAEASERLVEIRDAFKKHKLRDDCCFQLYNFKEDHLKILIR